MDYCDVDQMKCWLSLLLLMGALLGLVGQEVAFAQVMPNAQADQAAAAVPADKGEMSAECAEMMSLAKSPPQSGGPCQGMTPGCIAKMGCAVPLALIPPMMITSSTQFRPATPPQLPVARLIGRNTGPEPDPPTRLG